MSITKEEMNRIMQEVKNRKGVNTNDLDAMARAIAEAMHAAEAPATEAPKTEGTVDAALTAIAQKPGFASILKFVESRCTTKLAPIAAKGIVAHFKGSGTAEEKVVIAELDTYFAGNHEKLANFFNESMSTFFGVSFRGVYREGVIKTADTINFTGQAWQWVFYAIGDAGKWVTDKTSAVLYKHADVDTEAHQNYLNKGVDKVTKKVTDALKKEEPKKEELKL